MKQLIVTSEKQAFELLEQAINDELGDEPVTLRFKNWPILEIKLEGEGQDSTITSDMAGALVDLQGALNRAYARTVHQATNSRGLTAVERKEIQFKAKVEPGSSIITVNLGEFAEKLATLVTGKMTPEMLTITILGTALIGGSVLALKMFLKSRTEDKQIDQEARTKMILSAEETRRLEVFAAALTRQPSLRATRDDFDENRNEVLRAIGDASTLSLNSIPLDSETARVIASARRTQSSECQLNGNYVILATDLSKPDEIKLRVQRVSDGREFNASFKDSSLEQEHIGLLQAAEWERTPVYLSINARELRGEITSATVISVKAQPQRAQ